MLTRILEPELMDTVEDAHEYDAMDHSIVNAQFVTDLMAAIADWSLKLPAETPTILQILDLGAGTAQIPIELVRRADSVHVTAVDAAENMLALARANVAAASLSGHITMALADAKSLPFDSATFPVVISNSIIHHIGQPHEVVAEAVRVTEPGGLLFHRDLVRPADEDQLQHIVSTYASDATPYQRRLFANSLRAALTLDEMRNVVAGFGGLPDAVQMTSDRHWTWAATKM
ncbi:MAG TPA: class I SAM-dependent methyltransferase [Lacipirellulaceae bacterium]|nr:class I SAM-dependent methyltransferase [Lacipirellulaceae bacterium]